jgi:hypothetical protein
MAKLGCAGMFFFYSPKFSNQLHKIKMASFTPQQHKKEAAIVRLSKATRCCAALRRAAPQHSGRLRNAARRAPYL